MNAFTWPGQQHRDFLIDDMDNSFMTGWRLGCPNCGEMIAASPLQTVSASRDFKANGNAYTCLSTVCLKCNCLQTEIWSIN